MAGGRPLPRARLRDVVLRRRPLVGSRFDPRLPRGLVSPVEMRMNMGIAYGDLVAEEQHYLAKRSPWTDVLTLAGALITWPLATRTIGPETGSETRPDSRPESGPSAEFGDCASGRCGGGGRLGERVDPRAAILDVPIDRIAIDEALDAMLAPPSAGRAQLVCFVHPHALNLAVGHGEHRQHLQRADWVLPDGVGLRLAAALRKCPIPHNLNGTDMLPRLCERMCAGGPRLVLVGAAPGVAQICADKLRAAYPGLDIALVSHGYLDDDASLALVSEIAALGRCVVLVGMGSPRQEAWAWQYAARLPAATLVTVGGLFDFFSERIPRAPQLMRDFGLEWVFRLWQEPRRLARRYLIGNPLFLLLVAGEAVGLTGAAVVRAAVRRLLA